MPHEQAIQYELTSKSIKGRAIAVHVLNELLPILINLSVFLAGLKRQRFSADKAGSLIS